MLSLVLTSKKYGVIYLCKWATEDFIRGSRALKSARNFTYFYSHKFYPSKNPTLQESKRQRVQETKDQELITPEEAETDVVIAIRRMNVVHVLQTAKVRAAGYQTVNIAIRIWPFIF